MKQGAAGWMVLALGLLLVLLSALWWAFAPGMLVKIPKDVNTTIYYEGEYTWYVNPLTYELLPEGEAMTLPFQLKLNLLSQNDEYDSDTAVISGSVESAIGNMALPETPFAIVLDRSTAFNQADDRAYVIREDFVVDRSGSISYAYPFNTQKGTYDVWKEEIGGPIRMEFVGTDEKDGLTVFDFAGSFEDKEVLKEYVDFLGLPTVMSAKQLEDALARMGIDLSELLSLAAQRMGAEDKQALDRAMAEGVPIRYYWSADVAYSVEPTTGVIVDCYKDEEKASIKPDPAALAGIFAIFARYQQDPVLGPALQRLASMVPEPEKTPGLRVMEYRFSQTEEAVKKSLQDARKGRSAITLVRLWIPLFILVAGLIALLIGLFITRRKGGGKEAPPSSGERRAAAVG